MAEPAAEQCGHGGGQIGEGRRRLQQCVERLVGQQFECERQAFGVAAAGAHGRSDAADLARQETQAAGVEGLPERDGRGVGAEPAGLDDARFEAGAFESEAQSRFRGGGMHHQVLPGERILVVGAGVVGLLAGWLLARIPATQVTLIDIEPARGPLARRLGCRFASPAAAPAGQDLVVHASASEAGLRLALECAGFEARIIEASWFGTDAPAIPLGEGFHARRLSLLSSQVGSIAPAMRPRRSRAERLALALELLADARLDALLEPPTPFLDLPAAMPALLSGGLCHVISYGTPPCSA